MGFMQRVKVMLGLADEYDDEVYEDDVPEDEYYDDEDDDEPVTRRDVSYASPYGNEPASVRRVDRKPDLIRARDAAPLRPVAAAPEPGAPAPQVKIHTVEPRSYSEAQGIADKFKAGQPVIMNLTMTDSDLAKRLIDFASGLTYGLDGGLQKVSEKVFMLSPRNVAVSAQDKGRSRSGSGVFGE